MRSHLLWVTCAFVAVLGGCGASDDATAPRGEPGGTGGGAAGDAGDAGDGRHPNSPDTFDGAAVVHFEEVTLPEKALSYMLASEGVAARLDVRQAVDGGYEAVFTPQYGQQFRYTGQLSEPGLVLHGEGRIDSTQPICTSGTDIWNTITLGAGADGRPNGAMRATGTNFSWNDDVGAQAKASASGTFVKDSQPPEFQLAEPVVTSMDGLLLPWDSMVLNGSEGVDSTSFLGALATTGPVGSEWTIDQPPAEHNWAGALRATARLEGFVEADTDIVVSAAAGVMDTAGNASLPFSGTARVLGLGMPQPGFDLDSAAGPLPVTWGNPAPTFHGQGSTQQAFCEQGGCVVLRATSNVGSTSAIAGRLNPGGATRISVRFRVLSSWDAELAPADRPLAGAYVASVALPGQAATTSSPAGTAPFRTLTAELEGWRWATDWQTHVIELPEGATDDVGFAISYGDHSIVKNWCQVRANYEALVVDRIELQP